MVRNRLKVEIFLVNFIYPLTQNSQIRKINFILYSFRCYCLRSNFINGNFILQFYFIFLSELLLQVEG